MTVAPPSPPKQAALFVATLSSFLGPFMGSAVNVALPSIGLAFAMDAIELSWIPTAFLLAAAITLVPFGRLADIHGRKRVFLLGAGVFTIASALVALSVSGLMVILTRALQGIGAAMMFGTGVAILTSVFPVGERGRALGVNVAAVYLGLSLGPFVGGLITGYLGWRYIFWMNVPLGLTLLFVTWRKLQGDWAEARGARFDLIGALLLGPALAGLVYGLSRMPTLLGIAMGLGGMVLLALFILWETRTASPLVDIDLFRRNMVFAFSNLAALVHYSATFGVTFLLSLYLQYVQGLTPQQAGTILVCQPLVMAALSPVAGRLSDRVQPRTVASAGMGLTCLALLVLIALGADSSRTFIIACLVMLGIGFAFFSSPNTNAVMSSVEKRFLGVAGAMLGTMRTVGMMVSMGIVTMIFALTIGQAEIRPENHPHFLSGMRIAFGVFAVLCLLGIFASLARGEIPKVAAQDATPR